MTDQYLFQDSKGNKIFRSDVEAALLAVGADNCESLLVHSEMSFGVSNSALRRREILECLLEVLRNLGPQTLVFPTFTFSFSNNEAYDIRSSRSKMGVLTEAARKQTDAVRSIDPQMSFVVLGEDKELVEDIGKDCIGYGSTFDKFHARENSKILFLGTSIDRCFTHQHYVEYVLQVPYRYDLDFTGMITDEQGNTYEDTYTVFVKYRDVVPYTPPAFEAGLIERGSMLATRLGDAPITCFSEKDAYNATKLEIENNVNAFLAEPYTAKPLVKEYSYGNVTTVQ